MIVTCPSCGSKYRVRDEAVPAAGASLKCPSCHAVFVAHAPQHTDAELHAALARLTQQWTDAERRAAETLTDLARLQMQVSQLTADLEVEREGSALLEER